MEALVPRARIPEEPGAVVPHAGICEGGPGKWWSHRKLKMKTSNHLKAPRLGLLFVLALLVLARAAPGSGQEYQHPDLRYKLDGSVGDWKAYRLGWIEDTVGFEGINSVPRGEGIAFKGCYYDNDENFLYVFYVLTPTLQEMIQRQQAKYGKSSFTCHGLGSVWIDSDMDVFTGASVNKETQEKRVPGAEICIQLTCGIFWQLVAGKEKHGNFLDYDVRRWDAGKNEFAKAAVSYSSHDEMPLIGHDVNGIEMAIPLKDLRMKKGDGFRLSLQEHNGFIRRTKVEIK